jgi:hypothetical protein
MAAATLLAVLLVVPGQAAAADRGDAGPATPHLFGAHGSKGHGGGSNLIDHGGPVLAGAHLYAVWWGGAGAWPTDANAALTSFLGGFGRSSYLQIGAQYMRGATLTTRLSGQYVDPSAPPTHVNPDTLGAEVASVLSAAGSTVDPQGIYVVYTSNFPSGGNYCAWHSDTPVNGTTVAVAYMPNTTGVTGCDPGDLYGANGYSEGTRSLANVTAHELMEAVTDPQVSAWYDQGGQEIGDKCAWQFAGPVTIGGTAWQLQAEWSNRGTGCVQTT